MLVIRISKPLSQLQIPRFSGCVNLKNTYFYRNVTENKNIYQMKTCNYCGKPIEGKKATAIYCSEICRIRAYRRRNDIAEPTLPYGAKKSVLKPFLCCGQPLVSEDRGNTLICPICGDKWHKQHVDLLQEDVDRQLSYAERVLQSISRKRKEM